MRIKKILKFFYPFDSARAEMLKADLSSTSFCSFDQLGTKMTIILRCKQNRIRKKRKKIHEWVVMRYE